MQFGSSNAAVFFKMRVGGVLHIFQFETKQVSLFFHLILNFIIHSDSLMHHALLKKSTKLALLNLHFHTFPGGGNLYCSSNTYK